jgi:hypothetical protein
MSCPSCSGGNIFGPCGSSGPTRWVVAEGGPLWGALNTSGTTPSGTYAAALALVNAFDITTIPWGSAHYFKFDDTGAYTSFTQEFAPLQIWPLDVLGTEDDPYGLELWLQPLEGGTYPQIAFSRATCWVSIFSPTTGREAFQIQRCQYNIPTAETYAIGVWNLLTSAGTYEFGNGPILYVPYTGDPPPDSCANGTVTTPPSVVSVDVPASASSLPHPSDPNQGFWTSYAHLWEGGTCSDPP